MTTVIAHKGPDRGTFDLLSQSWPGDKKQIYTKVFPKEREVPEGVTFAVLPTPSSTSELSHLRGFGFYLVYSTNTSKQLKQFMATVAQIRISGFNTECETLWPQWHC